MSDQDAPTIVTLWDRSHTARKERVCGLCKDAIKPGERYQSSGFIVDGAFDHFVRHEFGEQYPSGCPRFRAVDLAEMAEEPA